MNPSRKLALKRETLRELADHELSGVAGGTNTAFSCLDYISCNPLACLLDPARVQR